MVDYFKLVSNISFEPFETLPYENTEYAFVKWSYLCNCRDKLNERDSGFYFSGINDVWTLDYNRGGQLLNVYPSTNPFISSNRLYSLVENTGSSDIIIHGSDLYIYDPINEIQGIPTGLDGHDVIFARGWIARYLNSYYRIYPN